MHKTSQAALVAAAFALAACGGGSAVAPAPATAPAVAPAATPAPSPSAATPPPPPPPDEARTQDGRDFALSPGDAAATTFAALAAAPTDTADSTTTSRWAGVLDGAAYRVEVPARWNGRLVMYAHGYAGEGKVLAVTHPRLRRHLVQNGYAWAASSYSRNSYDVRAGVEDTNALARAFTAIAAAHGRALAAPDKTYITGHSMGGHVAAAAVEDETGATARHKQKYAGAVPMCGVLGDTELFDYFAAAQVTAQALAGVPAHPFSAWADIQAQVLAALFTGGSLAAPTAAGLQYASVIRNLSGGPRPLFDAGLAQGQSFGAVLGAFGGDGTLYGILSKSSLDTRRFTYAIDGDAAGSAALNASVQELAAATDANPLRTDGLRWIPKANGEFGVPVVTIHTLGDLYVPFSMEQVYARRAAAKGNGRWLVQRAIRGLEHCDFTVAEEAAAFDAMVRWERDGVKPDGDDVATPATVARADYGCKFTLDVGGPDDSPQTVRARAALLAGGKGCPP